MSGKSKQFELDILSYVFNTTSIPNLSNTLYLSLHTADPGDTGNQTTNEANYVGYARVSLPRTSEFWSVSSVNGTSIASPVNDVVFPIAVGGSSVVTHFGIGTSATGSGKLLYSGTCSPTLNIISDVLPILNKTTKIVES